jgi:adenylylsulfate kinase
MNSTFYFHFTNVKGIYKKAQKGEIKNLSGVDAPFESPKNPQITIRTENQSLSKSVQLLLKEVIEN